jgi:histidyl-tRNA synthetase
MFRHERPQKGRHRQFYQVGAELIGREDPLGDAELLLALWDVLDALGVRGASLLLNSLGDAQCRPAYTTALREFGEAHRAELCPNCNRRLEKNPLRILDCKEPGCRAATATAPHLVDHLCAPCATHFARVRELLDVEGVPYELDWRLVRGLDYYVCAPLRGAVPAGRGRARSAPAPPTACGADRRPQVWASAPRSASTAWCRAAGVRRTRRGDRRRTAPDLFIAPPRCARAAALTVARRLRRRTARRARRWRSLKSLMRRADKLKAKQVMILGEEELAQRRATLRDMEAKQDRKLAVDIDLTGDELLAAVGARRSA